MQLYNKLSNEERAMLIKKANEKRLTLSFYKYHRIKNVEVFRNYLFTNFNNLDILGRIYVASEGINSQLSIPSKKMEELKNFLDSIYFLKDIRLNVGIEHHNESFLKLKIKIKDKIVADGLKAKDYDMNNSGTHVNAKDFNELLEKPETITIDMRTSEFMIKEGLWKGQSLYELYESAFMPWDWHRPLFEYSKKKNMTIFSSPFDNSAVDLLEDLNAPAYKIASFEITDIPLIEYIASKKKPIILSTGASTYKEVGSALKIIEKRNKKIKRQKTER